GGSTILVPGPIDNTSGTITATADTLVGPGPGVSGSGTLATVDFTSAGLGTSPITLSNLILLDSSLNDIAFTIANGSAAVLRGPSSVPEPTSAVLIVLGAA